MNGATFYYCGCRGETGRQLGRSCPRLSNPRHRQWGYVRRIPTTDRPDWQLRRRGHATQRDAAAELSRVEDLLRLADGDDRTRARIGDLIREKTRRANGGQLPTPDDVRRRLGSGGRLDQSQTVAEYLTDWLEGKRSLRPSTRRSYADHIRRVWMPRLGHMPVDRVRTQHVDAAVTDIFAESAAAAARDAAERAGAAREDPPRRIPGPRVRPVQPPTVARYLATLRAALKPAVRAGLLPVNPAGSVELPAHRRPKVRPWTPAEAGQFLAACQGDRLLALYELTMLEGLRRGEVCGLRWSGVDLDAGTLSVERNRVVVGSEVIEGEPKTASGDRSIGIGRRSVEVLRGWRMQQQLDALEWGAAWSDTGYVFTRADGAPLSPEWVSEHFDDLTAAAGVRRIRFHDLRHTAASLGLAAGTERTVVSKRLGHSSTAITDDIYSHLYEAVGRAASDAAADLIPREERRSS